MFRMVLVLGAGQALYLEPDGGEHVESASPGTGHLSTSTRRRWRSSAPGTAIEDSNDEMQLAGRRFSGHLDRAVGSTVQETSIELESVAVGTWSPDVAVVGLADATVAPGRSPSRLSSSVPWSWTGRPWPLRRAVQDTTTGTGGCEWTK